MNFLLDTHVFIWMLHALAVDGLPRHHNDPFDRLLVAQTQIEKMTLVTVDGIMSAYGVPILW